MGGPTGKNAHDTDAKSDGPAPAPEAAPAPGAGLDAIKAAAATGSLSADQAAGIVHTYLADAHTIFGYLQQQPQFGNSFVQTVITAERKLVAADKIKNP